MPDLFITAALTVATAAVVAWLVARLAVTQPIHRPHPDPAQQRVCAACGDPVQSTAQAKEHITDVHGLAVDAAEVEDLLTTPDEYTAEAQR